jgi:hypothetical protein
MEEKGRPHGRHAVWHVTTSCLLKVTAGTSTLNNPETGECRIAQLFGRYSPEDSGFWSFGRYIKKEFQKVEYNYKFHARAPCLIN